MIGDMRTKIVYVLVSSEEDYYYEMLLLSYFSLRLHHPKNDLEVVLVMDRETYLRLVNKKAAILDDVVPIAIEIPIEYTVKQRSRYIKTSLRSLIEGDFLYLDTDTIICESLDSIDAIEDDIAMVVHRNGCVKLSDSYSIKVCKRAGFDNLKGLPYYNGGVAFVKDSPICYRLFESWHESWKNQPLNLCSQDQPALCKVNADLGFPIKELPGIWNCQLKYADSDYLIDTAKVLHYFSQKSLFNLLIFDYIRSFDSLPVLIKQRLIDNPKSFGYMFYMNEDRSNRLISSGLPYLYEYNPPFYRLIVPLVRFTKKPIRMLSLLKRRIKG